MRVIRDGDFLRGQSSPLTLAPLVEDSPSEHYQPDLDFSCVKCGPPRP